MSRLRKRGSSLPAHGISRALAVRQESSQAISGRRFPGDFGWLPAIPKSLASIIIRVMKGNVPIPLPERVFLCMRT